MATASDTPRTPTLDLTLPSDREITLTRTFNACPDIVFEALTNPAYIRRWFGPPPHRGWIISECAADPRPRGLWRTVLQNNGDARAPACHEIVLHGTYLEITHPSRIVSTQLMEGCGGQGDDEALTTTTLEPLGPAQTRFIHTTKYSTREVRDRVLRSGASASELAVPYEQLATLLPSITPSR